MGIRETCQKLTAEEVSTGLNIAANYITSLPRLKEHSKYKNFEENQQKRPSFYIALKVNIVVCDRPR